MISSIDILSFNPRPADSPPPAAPELSGPPFGEYLSRAESERSRPAADDTHKADSAPEQVPSSRDQKETDKQAASAAGGDPQQTSPQDGAERKSDKAGEEKKADASEASEKVAEKSKKTDHDKSAAHAAAEKDKASDGEGEKSARHVTEKLARGGKNEDLKGGRKTPSDVPEPGDGKKPERDSAAADTEKTKDRHGEAPVPAEHAELAATDAAVQAVAGRQDGKPAVQSQGKDGSGDEKKDARGRIGSLHDGSSKHADSADRPKIELVDLRRERHAGNSDGSGARGEGNDGSRPVAAASDTGSGTDTALRQDVLVIDTGGKGDQSLLRSDTAPSQAAGELARALKEGGNGEILKKAQFMLKDRDQGEIRLILKPERLGEVRIRLNLTDKHIAGRIIVENNSVREVFQENMDQLSRAFRESGFQTSGLDVSVGGREAGTGQRQGRDIGGASAARMAEIFDEQMPTVDADYFADSRVNVYV